MTIISSQHYIDPEIVESKIESLAGAEIVVIPCMIAGEIDGEEYAVQIDKHHTLAAARELGLKVIYEISENDTQFSGCDYLDAMYMDGDWYNVETSDPANYRFDLIW